MSQVYMRHQTDKMDQMRLGIFSRKTNLDAILIAMAKANGPMRARALADGAGLEKPPQRFAFLRLVRYGLIRRCRGFTYELDDRHPIAAELRALLLRLGGTAPGAVAGAAEAKRAPSENDRAGMRQLFGGIETTYVLLRLAVGPMRQAALLKSGRHHLETAVEVLAQSCVIVRNQESPGRVFWQLNPDLPWHAELAALLYRIIGLEELPRAT